MPISNCRLPGGNRTISSLQRVRQVVRYQLEVHERRIVGVRREPLEEEAEDRAPRGTP